MDRNNRSRTSIFLGVILVFTLLLTQCAPPQPTAVVTTQEPAQEVAPTDAPAEEVVPSEAPAVEEVAPTEESVSEEVIELDFWGQGSSLEPWYLAMAEKYNETHNPKIKLNYLSTSAREAEQKLVAAIPAGAGPDIFDLTVWVTDKLVVGGFMTPNPPEVDAFLRSGAFSQDVIDYYSYPDGSYGLPLQSDKAAYFYNKKMFAEAGLDPNVTPDTYDELLEYAQKLTKYNADGTLAQSGVSLRLLGQGAGVAEKYRWVLYNFGADFIEPAAEEGKWHNAFNNDAGRAALQYHIDALYKYKVDSVEFVHDTDAFITEKTAMFGREAEVIARIKENNPDMEWGTFPMPKQAREMRYTVNKPDGIFVGPTSKNPELAWDFVLFLLSPESAKTMTLMSGWLPVRQDIDWSDVLAETPEFKPFVDPPADQDYFPLPRTSVFNEIQARVAELLVTAFADKTLLDNPEGIAAAVQEMADVTDQILRDNDMYAE